MAGRRLEHLLRRFKRLPAPAAEGTDCHLLERFAHQRDEAAFATLVRRHGPLVLGVGRRILQRDQDAEDVFQATFLLLARKAGARGWHESVAGWLYQVAYRLALRARARLSRQRQREYEVGSAAGVRVADERSEIYTVLDQELQRLAECYRAPVVLCYLETMTRDEAARQLGWSLRTLERRLSQGLTMLRARLARRGIELPVALLIAALAQQVASASAGLVMRTVEGALADVVGATEGALAAQVIGLADLEGRALVMKKLSIAALVLVALVGLGLAGPRLLAPEPEKRAAEEPRPPAAAVWPEGAIVSGRVVDSQGKPVADAEVLLLGVERLSVDADTRKWGVSSEEAGPLGVAFTRTDARGEFRLERKKGSADRLAVIATDPVFWVVSRKSLPRGDQVEIKLPASGSLAIHCDLPGKADKQPVRVELRTFDGIDWKIDVLRFRSEFHAAANPGLVIFEHLPPGQYAVERVQEMVTGKRERLMEFADRQLATVAPNQRAALRFERKLGQPLTGHVRGLENVELRQAYVHILALGPEEEPAENGLRTRRFTTFDTIPLTAEGRFTTDPMPPGTYLVTLFAIRASTLRQFAQGESSDFDGQMHFTVPERGEMPKVELVAKPVKEARPASTDYRLRVLDEMGKPVARFEAMIVEQTDWLDGRDGAVNLCDPRSLRDAGALDVLVRADGYAPALARFTGKDREQLGQGTATMTLSRGQKVELRFRLPEGLAWPRDVLPETYFSSFAERARMMRQPSNRAHATGAEGKMLALRALGTGRFESRLTADTPSFLVAIHVPGFLQNFEAGPFTLADVKDGALEIAVPRPAGLDLRFDPGNGAPADLPFDGVSLSILRGFPDTKGMFQVASATTPEFKLTDLAPGTYHVYLGTKPKAQIKPLPGTEINPGAYRDYQKLVLTAGKTERVDFRYVPFDPHAYRGKRSAVLRLRRPDGTPLAERPVKVSYQASHYGELPVFTGRTDAAGQVALEGITDQVPAFCPPKQAYAVAVDGRRLGTFGFTSDEASPVFEFRLTPEVGDPAPDVELRSLATGKSLRLSSLRGKVVCLEFWATWCGPCQPAMAKLSQLADEKSQAWQDRVVLLPVSIDATPEQARRHTLRRGWDRLDHHWTGAGADLEFDAPVARAFGVSGVPEAVLIGPDGRILWRGHPMAGEPELAARIEAVLTARPGR